MTTRSNKQTKRTKRSSSHQSPPPTFQGRPIVTVEWKGRKINAIAGRFALKRKVRLPNHTDSVEAQLMSAVSRPLQRERSGIEIVQIDPEGDFRNVTEILASILKENPDIEWIEPVSLTNGTSAPNDVRYSEQWGLTAVRFEQGMAHWSGNVNRVVLAVLDTGIPLEAGKLSHPDLGDNHRFFIGPDLVGKDDDPSDDHGHGTHIAGIAAAITNNKLGIAGLWQGPVYVIKVLDANNIGTSEGFAEGVSEAIRFAQDRHAHLVVNYSGRTQDEYMVRDAIQDLFEANGLLVAAAGNNYGFSLDYPAAYSLEFINVMAVGAVDKQGNRPEFGSSGPEMTVVAPGVGILSTLPNYHVTLNNSENNKSLKYDRLNGSSQAAAFVSALAALVWAKWPQLGADQVRERISQTAVPIIGPPEDFGSGMINVERALS